MTVFDQALGAKIVDLIAQETGGMVTAMHTVCEYIAEDGSPNVFFAVAPGQHATTSAGVLALAQSLSDFELRAYVGSIQRED